MCKCGHMAVWHKYWSGKCDQCECKQFENGKPDEED